MCDNVVSDDSFMLKYRLDKCKTKKMCYKAINDFPQALRFVPDWFATSKIIKKLCNALFADDDILFFEEDSGNSTFSSDEMGIISVDLNNINLY